MKKILHCLMVASIFVACNNKTDLDTKKDVILTDTTGMYKSNMLTDTGTVIQTTTLTNGNRNTAVANTRATNTNRATTSRTSSNRSVSGGTGTAGTSNSGTGQTTTQKKGWSKAAKGAVIGGASGAVVGAVISKKKGKGAIIGGVVGAAGGYILGRSKDKKDGRVQ